MAVLQTSEYDVNYFDGYLNPDLQHPAGSTYTSKWVRTCSDIVPIADCTGEYFGDIMQYYNLLGFLAGKKVLELGCAKGYCVEWLRDHGITAWGLDCSAYAIGQARADIQQYLTVADARTKLIDYKKNDFNVIYSREFLECISDADLPALITQMNRVGFFQVHHITTTCTPVYYNVHPISWWLTAGFKGGTRLVLDNDIQNPYTV